MKEKIITGFVFLIATIAALLFGLTFGQVIYDNLAKVAEIALWCFFLVFFFAVFFGRR